MPATPYAMYSQNNSQNGLTVATAWPQLPTQGVAAQNLDLLHIAEANSNEILVVVDYQGTVLSAAAGLVLTSVSVAGGSTTYNGTITGGNANGLVGKKLNVFGFTNAGNNVESQVITASTLTTIVVATTTQINETNPGQALPYVPGGQRVGRFLTRLGTTATLAQWFADAFSNPSQLDILQVINPGGNVHYYLNYQGVATGS